MKFDKGESKFEKMFVCVWRGGGTLTQKLYAKLCQLRSSKEIHNVEHVVNSTFLNLKNFNFEHSTKCILIKNLNLIKTVFKFNFFFSFFFIIFYSF